MHPDYPQPLGCLLVADHNVPDGFEPDTIDFLTTVAEQTAVAMENAELFEAIEEEERQLRGLLHALISTQEEERKRLVEDWRTRLGEKLFDVLQDFRRSKDLFLQRVPEATDQIDRLVTEIDTMAATVRNLTDELHPSTLDDFGFIAALQEYIAKLRENSLFRVTFEAQEPLLPLTPSANLTLFRITQEALENVNKHAQAQHVEIAFVQEHKGVSLLIKDDGQGFNLEQHPQGQYGLLYMRERAEACGGTLRVFSARGRGTEVRVDVPLE
jgi:signal transduction histidine kinase